MYCTIKIMSKPNLGNVPYAFEASVRKLRLLNGLFAKLAKIISTLQDMWFHSIFAPCARQIDSNVGCHTFFAKIVEVLSFVPNTGKIYLYDISVISTLPHSFSSYLFHTVALFIMSLTLAQSLQEHDMCLFSSFWYILLVSPFSACTISWQISNIPCPVLSA